MQVKVIQYQDSTPHYRTRGNFPVARQFPLNGSIEKRCSSCFKIRQSIPLPYLNATAAEFRFPEIGYRRRKKGEAKTRAERNLGSHAACYTAPFNSPPASESTIS